MQKVAPVVGLLALVLGACGDDGGSGGGGGDPDLGIFVPDTGPDVDNDVVDDDSDQDVDEQAPFEDVGDAPEFDVPPVPTFQESCAFAAASCLDRVTTPLSCTVGENVRDVVYDEVVVRHTGDGPVVFVAIDADGNVCASGARDQDPLDPEAPIVWTFDTPDGSATVVRRDDVYIVTCGDGSSLTTTAASTEPFLPELVSPSDALCERFDDDECTTDSACGDTCCPLADVGRCTTGDACAPEVNRSPISTESCADPLLNCFGTGGIVSTCTDTAGVGDTTWLAGQMGTIEQTAEGYTVEASYDGTECFTANFLGQPGNWTSVTLTSPDDEAVTIAFSGGLAQIACDDGFAQADATEILRYLPDVVEPGSTSCATACLSDADCAGTACCPNEAGDMQCAATPTCPPTGPLETSCIYSSLECFGIQEVNLCLEWDFPYVQHAEVEYVSGAIGLFLHTEGRDVARARDRFGLTCFETEATGADTFTLTGFLGNTYQVTENGDNYDVMCPDGSTDTIPTELVDPYLPVRPDDCFQMTRELVCDDNSCPNNQVCCDLGIELQCRAQVACLIPQPTCSDDSHCNGGVCCPATNAWICDAGVCSNGQLCCFADEADVCIDAGACP